jgi:low temperature requirement protein LtrA
MAGFFDSTYTPLIAFYITGRLHFAAHYAWLAYLMPMVRGTMIGFCIMNVIPSALWIGSIHVKEFHRQALIWLAMALDMYGGTLLSILGSKRMPGRFRAWSERAFEFLPARGVDELIARTEEFVTLVFGYSVVALLYQNKAAFGINAFLGKAILGLVQAFSFNWLYFEIDLFNLDIHAIRRGFLSGKQSDFP